MSLALLSAIEYRDAMAHASYAQLGNVIFRFSRRKDRDAWVASAPRGELRRAVRMYAQLGNVIFRFSRRKDRDAWVASAPRGELRRAVRMADLPLRLVTGRSVEGLELREGPAESNGAAGRRARDRRRR